MLAARASLEFDPETFRSCYNRKPFQFCHRLAGHPMLTIPELIRLAKRLPAKSVHQHRAEVTLGDDFYNAAVSHPTDRAIEETMENLEVANSYVMLRNPEVDPDYGPLLDPLWEEIGLLADPLDPRTDGPPVIRVPCLARGDHPVSHRPGRATSTCRSKGRRPSSSGTPTTARSWTERDLAHCVAEPRTFHAPFRPEFKARAVPFLQRPGLGRAAPLGRTSRGRKRSGGRLYPWHGYLPLGTR